ncbi:MAG: hypothetical protein Q4C96_11400 [Planctomycetia bacterium]|nr:hypothetical protein [Planctomycetia bacterium]
MSIRVEICCGTTCYMLGANRLLKIEEQIPLEWRSRVEVTAVPCNEACNSKESLCKAPFVTINGQLYSNVSEELLLDVLSAKVNEG